MNKNSVLSIWMFWFGCSVLLTQILPACNGKKPNEKGDIRWKLKIKDKDSLGYNLEKDFNSLLESCGVFELSDSTIDKLSSERSSIPPLLHRKLSIEQEHFPIRDVSAHGLFGYMFDKPVYNESQTSNFESSTRRISYGQAFPIPELPDPDYSMSSVAYRQTCSEIVSAAVSLKLNPPSASLRAAAEAKAQKQTTLLLVKGNFRSPFADKLLSRHSKERLKTSLIVWDHFYRFRDVIPTDPYYLSSFKGLVVYEGSSSELANEFSFNAQTGQNWAIAELDGKLAIKAAAESETVVKDYWVYVELSEIEPNKMQWQAEFLQFPTPKVIADLFKKTGFIARPQSRNFLQDDNYVHTAIAEYIPKFMCETSKWSVVNIGQSDLKIELQKVFFNPENNICSFVSSVAANSKFFEQLKSGSDSVEQELTYDLKYSDELKNNILQGEVADFLQIGRDLWPNIPNVKLEIVFSNDKEIEWTVSVPFEDKNNRLLRGQVLEAEVVDTTCKQSDGQKYNPSSISVLALTRKVADNMAVPIEMRISAKNYGNGALLDGQTCTATILLKLQLIKNKKINRKFLVELGWPRQKNLETE